MWGERGESEEINVISGSQPYQIRISWTDEERKKTDRREKKKSGGWILTAFAEWKFVR